MFQAKNAEEFYVTRFHLKRNKKSTIITTYRVPLCKFELVFMPLKHIAS